MEQQSSVPNLTQPAPVFTPQPQIPVQHKKSSVFAVVLSIIVMCAIGGGIFAYYKSVQNHLTPQEIFTKSLEATKTIRSLTIDGVSKGRVMSTMSNATVPKSSDFEFKYGSTLDMYDKENILARIDIVINAKSVTPTTTASLLLGIGAIYVPENVYLSLKDLVLSYKSSDPRQSGTMMITGMINGYAASLKDRWIQFDARSTSTPKINKYTTEEEAEIQRRIMALKDASSLEQLEDEVINGVDTYHIKATLNNINQLIEYMYTVSARKQTQMSKEDYENRMPVLSQAITMDMWIGKEDFLVRKVAMAPFTMTDKEGSVVVNMDQELFFSAYNKLSAITAPTGARPLKEVMQEVFGGLR